MLTKYKELIHASLDGGSIKNEDIKWILESEEVELLPLLYAAFKIRFKYFARGVKIHVINNVQSGNCSEDCNYCAQSRDSQEKVNIYPMKTDEEILKEAQAAYEMDAFRYCMVFSGRDLGKNRIDRICNVVKKLKEKYKMEVCTSAGFLTEEEAVALKNAGVDRYNHNLNTSEHKYGEICTTHTYQKRVDTIQTARNAGLDICSGLIIGMGESIKDIINIARELKKVSAKSVPINFFIPIKNHKIKNPQKLTPEYCLKVLCVFRFVLPNAEIRAAGGREYHLRSLNSFSLYPANSVFSRGYLTVGGESVDKTKQMILDSGFEIVK